jgi:enoyl-CoA hydratase/carnithine racemase
VTAAEADRRGLVSELVDPEGLGQRALELACAIADLRQRAMMCVTSVDYGRFLTF